MDKTAESGPVEAEKVEAKPSPRRWDWLPAVMPGVARLMREKRARYGDAHVNECWARSMAGEPGWLFAREGAVAIGTPWVGDAALTDFAALQVSSTQALLVMREPVAGG